MSRTRFLRTAVPGLGALAGTHLDATYGAAPTPAPPPLPTKEWPKSSPEAQGMDSRELVRLFEVIDRLSCATRSVLVVRYGCMVLDAHAPSVGPGTRQPIYSCTRSITSALVGIALDKGYLSSVSSPVPDLFPGRNSS